MMVPRSTLDELAGWGCFACEMHLLRETSSILRLVEKYIVDSRVAIVAAAICCIPDTSASNLDKCQPWLCVDLPWISFYLSLPAEIACNWVAPSAVLFIGAGGDALISWLLLGMPWTGIRKVEAQHRVHHACGLLGRAIHGVNKDGGLSTVGS